MKRVGVLSDSHGNLDNLRKAIEYLIDVAKVDYIIHLGDDYKDTEVFNEYSGVNFLKVPGVYDKEYLCPSIEQRIFYDIEGVKLLLSHTIRTHKTEVSPKIRVEEVLENRRADIILFGHTHKYTLEHKQGILLVNPGHLKSDEDTPPTFSILEIEERIIKAYIYELENFSCILSI